MESPKVQSGPPTTVEYVCWNCSEPNFTFEINTTMTALSYALPAPPDPHTKEPRHIPGKVGVMRVLTVCGRCRCVVGISWIPVDIPMPAEAPPPRPLIVPGGRGYDA